MAAPSKLNPAKGWFVTPDRAGDRTLEQQMLGLEKLASEVAGKRVIDAGAAEGLITIALARAGAAGTLGIEIVPGHVEMATKLGAGLPCSWLVGNLNEFDFDSLPQADVVLMLAVLHKLKDPSKVCAALAGHAGELCVIRLPPAGPVIIDPRSGNVRHDIVAVMDAAGFDLESTEKSAFSEWCGYFRRRGTWRDQAETKPAEAETKVTQDATNAADTATESTAPETAEASADGADLVAREPEPAVEPYVPSPPAEADEPKVAPRRRRGLGVFGSK